MREGSEEIGRRASARVAGIVFATSYLWATLAGVDGTTALLRAAGAGVAALLLGQLLCPLVINAVLDALARDQARREAELAKEAEDER